MSSLISRTKKGRNIKPRLILVDGVSKLILAKDKIDLIKLYLCYNMGQNKEEKFNAVLSMPDGNNGTILASVPIPIDTAWVLYCNLKEWVHDEKLPKQTWRGLK